MSATGLFHLSLTGHCLPAGTRRCRTARSSADSEKLACVTTHQREIADAETDDVRQATSDQKRDQHHSRPGPKRLRDPGLNRPGSWASRSS